MGGLVVKEACSAFPFMRSIADAFLGIYSGSSRPRLQGHSPLYLFNNLSVYSASRHRASNGPQPYFIRRRITKELCNGLGEKLIGAPENK